MENNVYNSMTALEELIKKYNARKPFVIMGRHLCGSVTDNYIDSLDCRAVKYTGVRENPTEESVTDALTKFTQSDCDMIISIGGGSAMDTAKAVKYRSNKLSLPHIAIPTTAGSGSEATPYSVVIIDGKKVSLSAPELYPEEIILSSELLKSLSPQQKKVSLLDALCHSIESLMTGRSTAESKKYADSSVKLILGNYEEYIKGNEAEFEDIFKASYYAGRAIAVTKTSVGHAMSYTLTTDYNIRHGQAVAICLIKALEFAEKSGRRHELRTIYEILGCDQGELASTELMKVYKAMAPELSAEISGCTGETLADRVNMEKLSNSAVDFDRQAVVEIYNSVIRFIQSP